MADNDKATAPTLTPKLEDTKPRPRDVPAWRALLEANDGWQSLVGMAERRGAPVEYTESGVISDLSGPLANRLEHAIRAILPSRYRVQGTSYGRFVANVTEG